MVTGHGAFRVAYIPGGAHTGFAFVFQVDFICGNRDVYNRSIPSKNIGINIFLEICCHCTEAQCTQGLHLCFWSTWGKCFRRALWDLQY